MVVPYYCRVNLDERFSEAEVRAAVARLAAEISRDYAGRNPLLIGVLKGSFVFLADLVRELTIPCEVDFVRARSYGLTSKSSGEVRVTDPPETPPAGRHVIVIEDILDTGLTLNVIVEHLRAQGPASLKTCSLLVREGSPAPDYTGLRTAPGFVVGYGIDYAEGYRGLRDIRVVTDPPA